MLPGGFHAFMCTDPPHAVAGTYGEPAMKKDQVQVGRTYAAKVSGSIVPVTITAEKWTGDRHVGWVGTNVKTGKTVRITSAQRLRNEVGPTPADRGDGGEAQAHPPAGAAAAPGAAQAGTSANGRKQGGGGTGAKAAKEPRAAKPKRVSAIDAAAQVLAEAGRPMKAKDMIELMEAKGLWKSPGGKTPEATLYAAIIREIAARKKEARFRKTERGTFEANV